MMGVVDEPEAGRPDERPGQNEPGNRRKVRALQEGDDRDRGPKHNDQVFEICNFRHTRSVAEMDACLISIV